MARVLVTRPPGLAEETAARLRAMGHEAIVSPLLIPRALPWQQPGESFDALLFTSPQAPELAGPGVHAFRHLPAFAVGERTAASARAAGFADVRVGGRDVGRLLRLARESGLLRLLHLGGRERTEVEVPGGLTVQTRTVYGAELANRLNPAALDALRSGLVDWTLLFSARTAGQFAALFDAAALRRETVAVAAISPNALASAGAGWRRAVAAEVPSEAGVLAAAGLLCDKPGE